MKTVFIEARYKGKIDFSKVDPDRLPKKIAIFTTVQYLDFLPRLKKHLEQHGKEVLMQKPSHAKYPGQILGCSSVSDKDNKYADAFLYMGDGIFHPSALALKNKKHTFIFNPISGNFMELQKSIAEKFEKQRRTGILKFHSSDEIGILVSTKQGQCNLNLAETLKKRFPEKNYYMLAFDTLDFSQLENFNFIECFVNTACRRLTYDDNKSFPKQVVDAEELLI
jgi:2-(3-amino-3-carboxypropyl)histidine synthase